MGEFLIGIKEKYPPQILKGRIDIEGNVISCFFKDMLLLDDVKGELENKNFISSDGRFYFEMLVKLRQKNISSLDEISILTSDLSEATLERYEEMGGWETIQHMIDVINMNNYETYIDLLYRENIICNMHLDGFNLLSPIDLNGKKIVPLKLLRRMTAEQVLDWYEARLSTYGTGYSSKVLEEEEIDFTDEFFEKCSTGEENGIPFASAGFDVNGDEINCFPFLSNQISGLLPGTLTMMGGYSSTGKSTWWVTVIMALLNQGRKVLIISNEEDIKKFKIKFTVWYLGKHNRYFKLTKKKLTNGNITEEDKKQLKEFQKTWRAQYKGRVKFIAIADANMGLVKKKIRENVLRHGYDTVLYDTLKIDFSTSSDTRQDLSLVQDSRTLDAIAKKYNIIMLASLQLAIHTMGKLFLDSSVLSNSKQIKEVLENLFLMRNVYEEEFNPKSKYYCRPFQLKNVNDKWIEEPFEPDTNAVWRMVFADKTRSGTNSSDTGKAYLLKFDGEHSIFRECAQCYPKHGQIV